MDEQIYSEKDIKILSIVECVLLRPKMYTSAGTIEEIYAYIQGCDTLVKNFRLEVRPPTPQDALNWIYSEINFLAGKLDFSKLREKYGSDEAIVLSLLKALEHLRPTDEN